MADVYHHGIIVSEINEGTRSIRTVSSSIIGLVATGNDADSSIFPLNRPVLITDPLKASGSAGETGTLAKSLVAIADNASPMCVVARVEEGEDEATTTANVISEVTAAGEYTGAQALLVAHSQLGVTPRILGVPELDNQAVTTAMVSIAQKMRSFVYASAWGCTTKDEAALHRQNFGSRELMLIWTDFTTWSESAGNSEDAMTVARAMGLRAFIDQDVGWHRTLSNTPVNGVSGLSRDVFWGLQNPNSDANYLNENEVTTLIRQNGFRFWGSCTCANDATFAFENYTRTAQILADTMALQNIWAVDKPMHPSLVRDIVESINAKFRTLKSLGMIIDAECWYDDSINTETTLKAGKLFIDYDYTPVPPLENLQLRQRITDRYTANFAQSL